MENEKKPKRLIIRENVFYPTIEKNCIHNEDCIPGMKKIADNSVISNAKDDNPLNKLSLPDIRVNKDVYG
jgi:hypothetical protein